MPCECIYTNYHQTLDKPSYITNFDIIHFLISTASTTTNAMNTPYTQVTVCLVRKHHAIHCVRAPTELCITLPNI